MNVRRLREFLFAPSKGVLEVFCGSARVTSKLRGLGIPALGLDIVSGSSDVVQLDVTDPVVFLLLKEAVANHRVKALWLGPPRSSWSLARRRRPGTPGGQLRSLKSLKYLTQGLPGLSKKDRQKIALGNKTMQVSADLLRLRNDHGIPCICENPNGSRMWHCPPMKKAQALHCFCNFCAYGAEWKKPTGLHYVHVRDMTPLTKKCSCTGPHVVLSGKAPDGVLWTRHAEAYPWPFASVAAQVLARAI